MRARQNRLFFRPEQSGLSKTDAAVQTLRAINPDVVFESHNANVTSPAEFDAFLCAAAAVGTRACVPARART